jgi:hypothetical protein
MNKIKGYNYLIWRVTEIIEIVLLVGILILEISSNSSLFINKDISLIQKLTNIFGIILIFYGWIYIIDNIINCLRKLIYKKTHKNKNETNYTKEQIKNYAKSYTAYFEFDKKLKSGDIAPYKAFRIPLASLTENVKNSSSSSFLSFSFKNHFLTLGAKT